MSPFFLVACLRNIRLVLAYPCVSYFDTQIYYFFIIFAHKR